MDAQPLGAFSCPYFLWVITVYEEHKLISFGYEVKEAVGLCHILRRDGLLETFMQEQEQLQQIKATMPEKENVLTV